MELAPQTPVGLLLFQHISTFLLIAIMSATESGIDSSATNKYPGATVKTGPAASGREIPVEEGGDISSRGRSAIPLNGPGASRC